MSTAAAAATVSAPPPEAAAPVSFRDERKLADATQAAKEEAPGVSAPTFKDARPLTKPSFRDERPVTAPSFRDTRPTAAANFRDDRAITAAPNPPPPEAAEPKAEPKVAEPKEPSLFMPGYFLEDRSPAVRAMENQTVSIVAPAPETKARQPDAVAPSPPSPPAPAPTPAAEQTPPPADGNLPTLVAMAPGSLKIDGAAVCTAPEVTTEPLDGGQMRIRVSGNCHPNEFVQISYGGAEFLRKLNAYGALDYVLDCFAGTASAVELRFSDGTAKSVPVAANDLDKVSKIAVVWRTGVNLDLHVFEYAAKFDQPGHFWSKAPSTIGSARVQGQADGRGHGYLSSVDDDKSLGDKLEVYTFYHNDQQSSGAISLALDNETRGENPSGGTCGPGALAEIDFQDSILPRQGQVSRQSGVLTRVECGTRLTAEARFNQSAMPGLRIRR